MERKNKISPLKFWVYFLIVATIFGGDLINGVKGYEFDWPTTPIPCTDGYCDYICRKMACGFKMCIVGKCKNNPKFRDNPVCNCHD